MGGQACVLYGAAEFSRDLDLALLPDPANLTLATSENFAGGVLDWSLRNEEDAERRRLAGN
jgi:hypothetical protein